MKDIIKINLIILVICVMLFSPLNVFAEEYVQTMEQTNSSASETEILSPSSESTNTSSENTEMDDLELEKNNLQTQIEEKESQVQYIQEEMSATLVELEELAQEISDKEIEIQELEIQELDLKNKIDTTEQELSELKEKYELQKSALEQRLVVMYKMGNIGFLDVLLNSKSLFEFLSNYYFCSRIIETDNNLLETVAEKKEQIQKIATDLETQKNLFEAYRETKEKTQIALSNMKIIKANRVAELNEQDATLHTEIEEYRSQVEAIEIEIRQLALANIGENYVGGTMAWPVPGYTRISSQYGMRTHPITGIYKLHTGTDISAPLGATFIAANDGVVVKAEYNTAYGNMVIIDHGGGVQTLYAHGNEILVEVGQTVFQGTPVLKVGSTGYSTGPHAHFEVRINGTCVDPLEYITSYDSDSSETEEKVETETVDLSEEN
jgi:murein DD-endopeptidase MepM/ murein hydrolase activator NlpD